MEERGLYNKYRVISEETGEEVYGCFVLKPQRDKAARKAIIKYAEETSNKLLRKGLIEWMESLEKYSCINPLRKSCGVLREYTCCANCFHLRICIENNIEDVCYFVKSGEVETKDQCVQEKRWEEV